MSTILTNSILTTVNQYFSVSFLIIFVIFWKIMQWLFLPVIFKDIHQLAQTKKHLTEKIDIADQEISNLTYSIQSIQRDHHHALIVLKQQAEENLLQEKKTLIKMYQTELEREKQIFMKNKEIEVKSFSESLQKSPEFQQLIKEYINN